LELRGSCEVAVTLFLSLMYCAVELDDELRRGAVEVEDERSEGLLAPELKSVKPAVS